jgi:hypothetical protein
MKEATLVLIAVVFAATPGATAARSGPAQPTTTVQGYGLSIVLPEGWNGRVSQASPDDAITLEASTVPLPPPGEAMTGDLLDPNDAYIVVDDIGTRDAFGEVRLPITLNPEDIAGPYEGGFRAGAGFGAGVSHRDLMFRVRFGSPPDPGELEIVNGILATFSATPPG